MSLSTGGAHQTYDYPRGEYGNDYFSHTCAVLDDGRVACWGDNYDGQLGVALRYRDIRNAAAVPGVSDASAVTAGRGHTCALVAGGSVECWGSNTYGQLGNGTFTSGPSRVTGLSGATAVTVSGQHVCASADGGVHCWGANDDRQLGVDDRWDRLLPTLVANGVTDARSLSSGVSLPTAFHGGYGATCAVEGDATLTCWGSVTGFGLTGVVSSAVGGGLGWIPDPDHPDEGDSTIYHHVCAAGPGGVRCWGDNGYGQLGDGTTTNRSTPTPVAGIGGAKQVVASAQRTCALLADETVACWGEGYGTTPVPVAGLRAVRGIAMSEGHQCAVKTDGSAWCWGTNRSGQLGDGTTTDRPAPVRVAGLTGADITEVAVGASHTCAAASDGIVRCWGGNWVGQLGDGTTTDRPLPLPVGGVVGATALAAGGSVTCAIVDAGALQCWGDNGNGQLGSLAPVTARL